MNQPITLDLQNILSFIQYLAYNNITPKVIANYLSSIRTMAGWYGIPHSDLSHHMVFLLLRSLRINSVVPPTPKGIFDIHTMVKISALCDGTNDPPLFRSAFVLGFLGFLRMSNLCPHSCSQFDQNKHLLRKDVIFGPPGVKLRIKWSKTQQETGSVRWLRLPLLQNKILCPVSALQRLLATRPGNPNNPLFVHQITGHIVIDTTVRDALKTILTSLNIPIAGHGFHCFRRSGATFAFQHDVSLQNIMSHGAWRSDAIWDYLQQVASHPTSVANTFAKIIPAAL